MSKRKPASQLKNRYRTDYDTSSDERYDCTSLSESSDQSVPSSQRPRGGKTAPREWGDCQEDDSIQYGIADDSIQYFVLSRKDFEKIDAAREKLDSVEQELDDVKRELDNVLYQAIKQSSKPQLKSRKKSSSTRNKRKK